MNFFWQAAIAVAVAAVLFHLTKEVVKMSAALDALSAEVRRNSEVTSSAVTLILGLAEKIAQCGTDPVALAALTDELKASADALAAAVVANTPAA